MAIAAGGAPEKVNADGASLGPPDPGIGPGPRIPGTATTGATVTTFGSHDSEDDRESADADDTTENTECASELP